MNQAPKVIQEKINNDIIEEHSINAVIALKPYGSIRITLDARNVNKIIIGKNHPIL